MEEMIAQWGYPAILLGTFFEGETVLLLGGFAVHQGYLHLDLVIGSAFLGSLAGDQVWFWVGRRFGRQWITRHPARAASVAGVTRVLDRWGAWFILTFRFFYGLRTISPIVIGVTSVSALRFTVLNIVAAALWATAGGLLGFLCGNAIEATLGKVHSLEHWLLAAAAIAVMVYGLQWLARRLLTARNDAAGGVR